MEHNDLPSPDRNTFNYYAIHAVLMHLPYPPFPTRVLCCHFGTFEVGCPLYSLI